MFGSLLTLATVIAAGLNHYAAAQQFAGEKIPNMMPPVVQAEIAFWNIKDPALSNNSLTLSNYWSLQNNGARATPSKVKRAVIVVHGLQRDAGTYMAQMISALGQVTTDSNINSSTVQIVAPVFSNGDDKNITYPYYNYSSTGVVYKGGAQSNTSALVWKGSTWISGQTNQYPIKSVSTSPYDCLDQMLQYFDNKTLYPNLNQIVLAGHSAGAQLVDRYAAVQKSISLTTPVTFWIGNPNDWLWLNSSRPYDTSTCTTYDSWRSGLSNYASSGMLYNTQLVARGSSAVTAQYLSKNKAYARGTQDLGDDSSGCEPFTSGQNRNERFFNFINWWRPSCPAPNATTAGGGHCDTVDFINVGHDSGSMFASVAGQARLFKDNFYGNGARAYDFTYPRMQQGDDPFPDPAQAGMTIQGPSTKTFAGNMTYAGCWTDTSFTPAMRQQLYDSTNNTIELCAQTCADKGYSVAGLTMGSRCYCDNSIAISSSATVDTACTYSCSGNTSETCGANGRLSIYASGNLARRYPPSNLSPVGNYSYVACYGEATSGRALSVSHYSDPANMTLESCASFCTGSNYFGIEFATECYCGSYLRSDSSVIANSTCAMACSGNETELCGGSNALSVYGLTSLNGEVLSAASNSNLCPTADAKIITEASGQAYMVHCSSDCTSGSYLLGTASESYLDCMSVCDADSKCQAFTYVGGTNGDGGGNCWLKASYGSSVARANTYISVERVSNSSSSGTASPSSAGISTTSTVASQATSSSNPSLCPTANGQVVSDAQGNIYSITCSADSTQGSFTNQAAASSYLDCMTACDATTSCAAFTYVGGNNGDGAGTCWLKTRMGSTSAAGINYISATRVASNSSSSNSSIPTPSTSTSNSSAPQTTESSINPSLCPAANGKVIADAQGNTYNITCSADSTQGAFTDKAATASYLDCMSACDSTAHCAAFTYVGGNYGDGSGTCWLKTSMGSASPTGANYISAARVSNISNTTMSVSIPSSSTGLSTSASINTSANASTSTSTSPSSTSTGLSCPSANQTIYKASTGSAFLIECGMDHPGGDLSSTTVEAGDLAACITACAKTTGCVDVSLLGAGCYLKSSVGVISLRNNVWGARLIVSTTSASLSVSSSLVAVSLSPVVSSSALATSTPSVAASASATASTAVSSVPSTSSTSTTVSSKATPSSTLSTGLVAVGCFVDTTRPLPVSGGSSSSNTPDKCALKCRSLGYKYSGTEFADECYCGNSLPQTNTSSTDCNMACSGDQTLQCGAGNRLSVVQDTTWVQTFFARSSYNSWNLLGCFPDQSSARLLPAGVATTGGSKNMTIANCINACENAGFSVCGAEYYGECYGSNAKPDNTSVLGTDALQAGCSYPCYGNSTEACGGSNRILVYSTFRF